jgi:hypothetical protein
MLNTFTISGRVLGADGQVIAGGVTVNLSGSSSGTTVTDANGNYSFANLSTGGNYTVAPAAPNFVFTPPSRTFNALGSDQTADFTGLPAEQSAMINYSNFSSTAGLNLVGNAAQFNDRLRLTPAISDQRGAAWFTTRQFVQDGFSTTFQFQITQPGADGFTFAIQNTDVSALGDGSFGGSGLGYHNIPNSLVVEFDTFGECNSQISVHTRGAGPNSADESASIGSTCNVPDLKDGGVHTVRVDYVPGTMRIFIDSFSNALLTVPVDLATTLNLDNGRAFAGFTAATGGIAENHDILNWFFNPAGTSTVNISGQVTDSGNNNQPLSGVTVTLSGTQSATTTTDGNGFYSFTNLTAGGTYTVTPTLANYSLHPAEPDI